MTDEDIELLKSQPYIKGLEGLTNKEINDRYFIRRTPEEMKEQDNDFMEAYNDIQRGNIIIHETFHEDPKRKDSEFTKSELYAVAITIGSLAFGITLAVYAIHNSFI